MGTPGKAVTAAEGLEAYRRWQKREEGLERLAWQDSVIANGDPECEELIVVLEAGWLKDAGRER